MKPYYRDYRHCRLIVYVLHFVLPVAKFMSDGDPQIKACVLCDYTAPVTGASPTKLCYPSDLLVPIRQLQIIPECGGRNQLLLTENNISAYNAVRYTQPTYLVIYKRRSACNGSVSLTGLILLPQSHTLLRDEVMLVDIWISG